MKLIAAIDKNWAIGYKNKLLFTIPDDMEFFRKTTIGKVVVMGRKTADGIPGGFLKNRVNIVLTNNKSYDPQSVIVVHSVKELIQKLGQYNTDDIYVIGGESIYRQLLNRCNTAYITKIDSEYNADTFFPNLNKISEWKITANSDEKRYLNLCYHFLKYEKIVQK